MITIYGLQSPYVYRVRACLIQKGLEFQHVSVNLGNRSEEFKRLSPVGTIPALEDDDCTILTDSFHIGLYLDEKYPKSHRMFGNTLKEKAFILNVLAVIDKAHQISHPFSTTKYAKRLRASGSPHRALLYDDEQKGFALADLSRRLLKLEELRGKNRFFCGQFSFADAAMLCLLKSLESAGNEIGSWKEWRDDILNDGKIALMFTPQEKKSVREI